MNSTLNSAICVGLELYFTYCIADDVRHIGPDLARCIPVENRPGASGETDRAILVAHATIADEFAL